MDNYNLFEPDLELGRTLIPYNDMEIQGVWPRKQRAPSDVFPTNAALIGRGPNNDARWLATDSDGVLLTNPKSSGSSLSTADMTDLDFAGQAKPKGLSGSIQGIAYSTLKLVYGYSFSFIADGAVTKSYGSVWLSIVSPSGGEFILCSLAVTSTRNYGQANLMFPVPIAITTRFDYHGMTLNVGNPDCDVLVTGALYTNPL